jgi:hypothetical protein
MQMRKGLFVYIRFNPTRNDKYNKKIMIDTIKIMIDTIKIRIYFGSITNLLITTRA